jgi:aminopeptidase YwaD
MQLTLRKAILFTTLLIASCTASKKIVTDNSSGIKNNVYNHVRYLADDKLEGRRTGTNGERLAMEYISDQFKTVGLIPKGTDGYYQAFDVNDGKQMAPSSYLIVNGNKLEPEKDFFIFPYSPDHTIEALPSMALREADMPWFFDLKETLEENKENPHFDLSEYLISTIKSAASKKASAVIFYNTSNIDDKLAFDAKDKTEIFSIPVLYIYKPVIQKYLSDNEATINIKMKTGLEEKKRIGHNVIGYVDNGATNTVILGAHFDHLGYGEDGNSMLRTGEHLIHNGADDNASGTAALIELARLLKNSASKNNNYLFIAFSGEELGLFGSKYFTEHPTVDLRSVDYMINMDMVGRFNDSSKVITIGGYGTSPAWGELFSSPAINSRSEFIFKYDSSGTGPSDHTSFYRKDIPVLFYFTGLHSDYHKPTDDFDKINYGGEQKIIMMIYNVVQLLDKKDKLVFTKTRETQTSTSARFSVSLGIMPDYTFAGSGVRADGISDNRPAQKAGIKAGDVIIQLGDYNITSLENYMQALGKFKKGDTTKVKLKRENEVIEVTVQF